MSNEENVNSGRSHKSDRADRSKNEILSKDSNEVSPRNQKNMEKESKSELVKLFRTHLKPEDYFSKIMKE